MSDFSPRDGLWPQVIAEFSIADAIVIVQAGQGYAVHEPHEQLIKGHDSSDYGFTKFTPTAHQVFHFVARQIAATLVFTTVPRSEHIDVPSAINPLLWIGWLGERVNEYPEPCLEFVFDLRAEHWTDVDDFSATLAALDWAAAQTGPEAAEAQRLAAGLRQAAAHLTPITVSPIELSLAEIAKTFKHCGDYGQLWWNASQHAAWWTAADSDGESATTSLAMIEAQLGAIDGVRSVTIGEEYGPTSKRDADREGWVLVHHQAELV